MEADEAYIGKVEGQAALIMLVSATVGSTSAARTNLNDLHAYWERDHHDAKRTSC